MSDNAPPKDFIISRVFDAPRDLLWRCFSEPERLQHWWGPKGVKIVKPKVDFRPGGSFHYGMQNLHGDIIWGLQVYREIVPPERIVLINSFSDENGGLGRHPLAPDWPLQMLGTFTFDEMPGGKTRFTVRSSAYESTAKEREVFDANHASMTGGWSGTFDQLEAYLASTQQQQQQ